MSDPKRCHDGGIRVSLFRGVRQGTGPATFAAKSSLPGSAGDKKTERSQARVRGPTKNRVKYEKAPGKICIRSDPTGTFQLNLTQT